ncbi:hypothetical protein [Flavobacterium soli]|uniref:hypothetical protein n=1 Tax=Flavobacterium soli TaxID=344881 RepID=UPI00040BEFD2|nr:hypothetical protein [Flavobacterium soli]
MKEQFILLLTQLENLADESFNSYAGTETKNADYYLEMGKCSAYGEACDLIKNILEDDSKRT